MDNRTSSFHGIASTVSIGAAALVAGVQATEAVAQEPYVVTADGGITFSDFSDALFDEKGGTPPELDTDLGFFGSVAVSKKISDTWDWRVSGTLLAFGDNTISEASGGARASFDQSMTGLTADADFGWLTKMGNTDLRLGVGLLAADYDKGVGFNLTNGIDGLRSDLDVQYTGFGPKFSADLVHPVSADGRMNLIAGASLAPTTGDIEISQVSVASNGDRSRGGDSQDADALVSSAYIGLSIPRSDTNELRMGLRLDNIDTDVDGAGSDGIGLINDSILSTSLFVGMRIEF